VISDNPATDTPRKYGFYGCISVIGIAGIIFKKPSYILKMLPLTYLILGFMAYPKALNPFN